MSPVQRQPLASFRDPSGSVVFTGDRVLRLVNPAAAATVLGFLGSELGQELIASGHIVQTKPLSTEDARSLGIDRDALDCAVLQHEAIPFVSYPYEWPAEMLDAAAHLTLEIAGNLLAAGLGLKDATPYNVLFRGARPVFVDLLSIEARDPRDAVWLPYGQFARTFLLPLLMWKQFSLPVSQVLLERRDGVEPEEVYYILAPYQRFAPRIWSLVTLPTWLGRRQAAREGGLYKRRTWRDPEQAQFVLRSLLRRAKRTLNHVAPAAKVTRWSEYTRTATHYTPEQRLAKQRFVEEAVSELRPADVIDLGCNTGEFSTACARQGCRVVAVDNDAIVCGQLWNRAREEQLDILPLVVNIARPTPATGWRNLECLSFLDRCRQRFDLVLILALIHHLVVNERIPLPEIVQLASEFTRSFLLLEFVPRDDPMFRLLVRGRDDLYQDYTRECFEEAWRRNFEVVRESSLPGSGRRLYLLRRRVR